MDFLANSGGAARLDTYHPKTTAAYTQILRHRSAAELKPRQQRDAAPHGNVTASIMHLPARMHAHSCCKVQLEVVAAGNTVHSAHKHACMNMRTHRRHGGLQP